MHASAQMKKAALEATRQELDALCARGVRMEGNAFSPIVLIKGDLNEEERAGGALLGGADGTALRASCTAIGYAPEDFCALAAVAGEGDDPALTLGATLPTEVFRETLEALDPEAVLLLDATAADLMRETYADALVAIDDFDTRDAQAWPGGSCAGPSRVGARWIRGRAGRQARKAAHVGLYQTDRSRRRSVLRTGAGLDARHIYWLVNFALEPVLLSSLAAFVFCRFVNCTVLGAQLARQLLLGRKKWQIFCGKHLVVIFGKRVLNN